MVDANNLAQCDDHKLWLSSKRSSTFPHIIIANFTHCPSGTLTRSTFFRALGFRCWHGYTTNPSQIRLSLSSSDQNNFVNW